jgi:hypothetical protein
MRACVHARARPSDAFGFSLLNFGRVQRFCQVVYSHLGSKMELPGDADGLYNVMKNPKNECTKKLAKLCDDPAGHK